jgi:hypothetical protein
MIEYRRYIGRYSVRSFGEIRLFNDEEKAQAHPLVLCRCEAERHPDRETTTIP